ncbi:CLIP-associating protein 2 isoform X4 [Homalodisca vitripennis]|uniref:CLIP-associating protein 2 isoform X4 n=1 Tax=Homalodisca vitripennis TaxID=197043 RepID=UPI001EEB7241|nr:CLIP-associating protein 2 isoform X4 [Homalodisca vitripennis]
MASKKKEDIPVTKNEKIDRFVALLPKTSINKKANELGPELIKFLVENPDAINDYPDASVFTESLGACMVSNQNPKVTQYGLEALILVAEAMQSKYKNYYGAVLHHVLTKLGDSKDYLREKARAYLLKTVEVGAHNPNNLIEKLVPLLHNKNRDTSTESQKAILEILMICKNKKLSANLLTDLAKTEVKCLEGNLRDEATEILMDIGERIGRLRVADILEESVRMSMFSAHHVKKIQSIIDDLRALQLEQQQQALKDQGNGVTPQQTPAEEEDEPDFAVPKPKKVISVQAKPKPQQKPATAPGMVTKSALASAVSTALARSGSIRATKIGEGDKYALHSGPSGEADENWFLSAFEDVPDVPVLNHREFDNLTKKLMEDLKSGTEFWEKKVEALRKLRSMMIHLTGYDEEIQAFIKAIALLMMSSLKDLRSQVVRETCLTFAFICRELRNKIDQHTCEIMMHQLMNNVMSSARVIANASYIALKFMFTYVTHGRLVSALVHTLVNSKSREVRTAACEFLYLVLHTWPVHRLEQQIPTLQEGIKRGIVESSNEGRMASRKAFWAFRTQFPEQGDALLNSMDAICRKSVMAGGEQQLDNPPVPKPKPLSQASHARQARNAGGSVEDLSEAENGGGSRTPSTPRRSSSSAIPVLKRSFVTDAASARRQVYSPTPQSIRSNSAIDLQAVQRANARQQYAALARQKIGCGASLPRAKKSDTPTSGLLSAERSGRTREKVAGVSHSQPSSRSGSPSSRLGYHGYNLTDAAGLPYQSRRTPRSRDASRETSPNRFVPKSTVASLFAPRRTRPPIQPSRPVMAQKMLAKSLEAENVPLTPYEADTPDNSIGHKVSPRKTSYRSFEDHSDDSDASSLCSERSFDSYRRTSDSYSWSGSQQRLYRDVWDSGAKDINEIILNCESIHWCDRKEGLVGLQVYLQAGNTLNPAELKRVTDIFTRMFMDSHTKVFSLFLDALNELMAVHRADLNSWLYVLLTRLLNKLGADLLGSIQSKIQRTLDIVRESFPHELQMASLLRFLTDPTQTPNLRVKTAALNYITKLAAVADPSSALSPPSAKQTARGDPLQAAMHKMIGWTMGDSIKQGTELRRAAQEAIMALFNLNTPQVTLRLANLPQEYQEAAATLLKGRVRRGSSSSGGGTNANSPPSPTKDYSPRLSSPGLTHHPRPLFDSDDLKPEDIYKSLRKTTAEIQNYTYDTATDKIPDKDNTTSKDSGISQLSGTEALEEAMEELSLQSSSSSNATTTTLTNRVLTVKDCNNMDMADNTQTEDSPANEQEAMRKIVEALKSPPDSDNGENVSIMTDLEKRASLGQLTRLIRDGSVTTLQENFKALLRILLGNLALDANTRDVMSRILVLTALTELIKKRAIIDCFNNYVELLILKVLNSYKDTSKEVVRNAESCANTIATTLAPEMVIRVLAPLIQTGEFPLNLAALKMLTRLVEYHGRDPVYNYLPDLMPGLIQAYDNQESSVRKSAVFCMVSLHAAIGEEDLNPHLTALNGSKLKLLHLYIRRAQQGSSAPTSPRNHPPSATS